MVRLKYPITVTGGRLAFSSSDRAEKNLSVLSTIRGERVYWSNYGSPISIFDKVTDIPSYAQIIGESTANIDGNSVDLT